MNRIVHLALKVEDLERTTEFYRKVFGFKEMNTAKVRDHTSRHLSDGVLDIALIKYDAGTQSAESKAAGEGPCIHHFAVEVDNVAAATKQVQTYGCEIISDPGVIPVKFRAPGGTVCELVPKGRYNKPKARRRGGRRKPTFGLASRSAASASTSSRRPGSGSTSATMARGRGSFRCGTGSPWQGFPLRSWFPACAPRTLRQSTGQGREGRSPPGLRSPWRSRYSRSRASSSRSPR